MNGWRCCWLTILMSQAVDQITEEAQAQPFCFAVLYISSCKGAFTESPMIELGIFHATPSHLFSIFEFTISRPRRTQHGAARTLSTPPQQP